MEKNQNDKSNQQSDSKSHLEKTQEGKKKEETNPNNPTANQSGGPQGKQNSQGSSSPQGRTNHEVDGKEENEEETSAVLTSKKGNSSSSQNDGKGSGNSKK